MARSLRPAASEPTGEFTAAGSATRFTVYAKGKSIWQSIERAGEKVEYPVAYAMGSGNHATGYLIEIAGHLFQSPICYYTNRQAYDLAPGFERITEPDFTRPVRPECLLCHSGRPLHVAGTVNHYTNPIFAEEAISCERCHGPTEEHLRRPARGSIVNPAKLEPAARDSVCEQCHLAGVTRVLNPGMTFGDFHAGRRSEEVFTVYRRPAARAFKVISHVEHLALSSCARNSQGKLWCGTCHDPHPVVTPTAQTYAAKCQVCHEGKLPKSHSAAINCVSCHMPRRRAQDGGHTVFTDHRIAKKPEPEGQVSQSDELVAWREPATAFRTRNLALAYVNAGIAERSPAQIVRGYRMLTEVQRATPDDVGVLAAIGRALLLGKQPGEALKAFERVVQLVPDNATNQEDVGVAYLELGQLKEAAGHLERALELDPLQLSAAAALEAVYQRQGEINKTGALRDRMRRLTLSKTN